MRIALVGDRRESVRAHARIEPALTLASRELEVSLAVTWIATDTIGPSFDAAAFDGVWCTPGSLYASTDGALRAVRSAREQGVPFVGT